MEPTPASPATARKTSTPKKRLASKKSEPVAASASPQEALAETEDAPKKRVRQRKSEQLIVRITPRQKGLIQRAAELEGMTLTEFVTFNLNKAAKESLKDHEIIKLSERDAVMLAQALLSPPREPNQKLLKAAKEFCEEMGL